MQTGCLWTHGKAIIFKALTVKVAGDEDDARDSSGKRLVPLLERPRMSAPPMRNLESTLLPRWTKEG